jgi:hypothetical protein
LCRGKHIHAFDPGSIERAEVGFVAGEEDLAAEQTGRGQNGTNLFPDPEIAVRVARNLLLAVGH